MFSYELLRKAESLLEQCRRRGWRLATAESCTGGLIAGCLTAIAGSSEVFDRSIVSYSNPAKTDLLGVSEDLLRRHGAVNAEVAEAMVRGVLARSPADLAIAVTGIAGPDGGSPSRPVGLVYLAVGLRSGAAEVHRHVFPGDRTEVRLATVAAALDLLTAAAGAARAP